MRDSSQWRSVQTSESSCYSAETQSIRNADNERSIGMREVILIGSVAMLMTGCIAPFPSSPGYGGVVPPREYYDDEPYYGSGPFYDRPYYGDGPYYAERP